MKWYEQRYVNRRDWIFENYEYFNFSTEEAIICLAVDFLNSNNISITYDVLSKKTNLSSEELDRVISILTAKKYLAIKANAKGISFSLKGLFENDVYKSASIANDSVFKVFEQQFGRPLTHQEVEKINEWIKEIDSKMMVYALKLAVLYNKVNMAYIDAILRDWQDKGITLAMLKNGQYNASK